MSNLPSPPSLPAAGEPPPLPGRGVDAAADPAAASDPVLCGHCGRTASNGLSCIGMCVADSGY